jgi:AcrR family transcriptional regulator
MYVDAVAKLNIHAPDRLSIDGSELTVPALGRRERNKLEKRSRIVAAARALFKHKGFDATTSAEIAIAARVAAGTVFTYARTKDELLIMVFHEEMVELAEKAYQAASKTDGLLEQAIAFFETIIRHHERDLPLARALMRELGYVGSAEQRSIVEEITATTLQRLRWLVGNAKSNGEVAAETSLSSSARALFAIFYYHLGSWISGYVNREQFDRALRLDLSLLLRGLS